MNKIKRITRDAIVRCGVACEAALSAEHREMNSRNPDLAFAADMADSAAKWSARAFDWASELSA